MKVRFEREKETRNTVKYHEVAEQGKPPIIGTLYVQKWYAGDCKELTLTVEKREPALKMKTSGHSDYQDNSAGAGDR